VATDDENELRADLPDTDASVVHHFDLNDELVTKGLKFDDRISHQVALALVPLLRVALEPSMWGAPGPDAAARAASPRLCRQIMETYARRFQKFIVTVEKLEEDHGIMVSESDRDGRLERLWMQCLLLLVQNTNLRHRRDQAIKAASLDNRLVRPRDGTAVFVPQEVRDAERDELVDVWKNSKRSQVEILRDLRAGVPLKQARSPRAHKQRSCMPG